MENSGIYLIRCPAGKYYVGHSRQLRQRLREHRRALSKGVHYNNDLQQAWDSCVGVGFEMSVVEYCETGHAAREEHWINTMRPCGLYNRSPATGQRSGHKWTEEQKAALSARRKADYVKHGYRGFSGEFTEEHLAKLRQSRQGRKPALGMKMSEGHREALIRANTGRPHWSKVKKEN